ncbi:HEAT repeat domain-containing protein [Streptomyces sp. x-80]|uniref:HEAT repeat domain-containing protein n=1 Tax=Streptomyces sp. x-80 TaxID=2789282 RepID=UPI003980D478
MSSEDRTGETAAVRLGQGTPLPDVLDTADPAAWIRLDIDVRHVASYRPELIPAQRQLGGLRPRRDRNAALSEIRDRVERLDEPGLAFALCHRNGTVRKAALSRAAEYPALVPLIVLRGADWAPPVRDRAQHLLRDILPRLTTEETATLAPLLLRVGDRDRGAFGVELLRETLRQAPHRRLAPLLAHADRAVRRFAHRIAVDEQVLTPAELARTAAGDPDTAVQNLCAEAALARMGADEYADVLDALLTARNPRTRSAGVTALRPAGRPAAAQPFLTDRSALVRACARYVLRQYGTDPLPLYRSWCAHPDDAALPPGAPIGLAECGTRADAELLWPLITHPASGVRARAVAGLRTLDVTDTDRLRPLLEDPAPAVARETATALLPSADRLSVPWLRQLLAPHRPRHTRLAAFRLLDAQGGILQLRTAVGLLDDADGKLRTWAEQSVRRWLPPHGVPRGDAEAAALLDRCEHLIGAYVLWRHKRELGIAG